MIAGIFHEGSGLGDQLFRYITLRTLAEKKGYEWGMINGHSFKGKNFLNVQYTSRGNQYGGVLPPNDAMNWQEKDIRDIHGNDIRSYDPEINFVEDNTIIDGSFEDYRYWGDNLHQIDTWLRVEPLALEKDTCVISHRGGEYKLYKDLYLPDAYWHYAVRKVWELNPNVKFIVQTDDTDEARRIFPNFEIIENKPIRHSFHENMGLNWRYIRYAPYLIVGNSAFSIIPSLLSPAKVIFAPKYHAGHNVGIWKRPACYYDRYTYIDPREYEKSTR